MNAPQTIIGHDVLDAMIDLVSVNEDVATYQRFVDYCSHGTDAMMGPFQVAYTYGMRDSMRYHYRHRDRNARGESFYPVQECQCGKRITCSGSSQGCDDCGMYFNWAGDCIEAPQVWQMPWKEYDVC